MKIQYKIQLKTFNLTDAVIEQAVKRVLTVDRFKISPYTVRRNLRSKIENAIYERWKCGIRKYIAHT